MRNARTTMSELTRYLVFGCAVALLAPHFAIAQASPEAQNPQELRRQLDELRVQQAEQMRLMNALQARIEEMERMKTLAAPATDQQAAVPPSVPTKQVGE